MTAGRWPWKSESAKECATTHLPKQPALKMDGAEAFCLYTTVTGKCDVLTTHILVVVANTPARPWRTDVEKGFA
ncbi:unnamed protein product [Parnassius mnemosyne]|uniref:Uncharacterized protein n=1 Tax=Parnassius mnemosyne TaxID=213953 RepID=A0AAV1KC86_9NEOP